jgi:uncharacterized OsmC-like protein
MPTAVTSPRRAPAPLNGVNTPALFATIDAVRGTPALAGFQFRARNRWVVGTCSETTIDSFAGAGGEHQHRTTFQYRADHPAVLVGEDRAVTPVEFLLHALTSCICSGVGNIAAARGIALSSVESTIEGDIDLRGILGLSADVRNGYQQLRVRVAIAGDAPRDVLEKIVEQARARSAVYDVLTNGVPVELSVTAA